MAATATTPLTALQATRQASMHRIQTATRLDIKASWSAGHTSLLAWSASRMESLRSFFQSPTLSASEYIEEEDCNLETY